MIKSPLLFRRLLLLTIAGCLAGSLNLFSQYAVPLAHPESNIDIDWLSVHGVDQAIGSDETGIEVVYTLNGKEVHGFIAPGSDTFLWKDATTPNGTSPGILLRDGRYSEGLIRLDLDDLPAGAQITSASLRFKVTGVQNKGKPGQFSAYRILTPWTEDAIWHRPVQDGKDWNGLKPGEDYDKTPFSELSVDVLDDKQKGGQILSMPHFEDALKQWQSRAWPNEGFLLVFKGKALQLNIASHEAAANAQNVVLGGPSNGKLLLEPNTGELAKLLLKTDDLLGAQVKITVEKMKPALTPTSAGTLNLYALSSDDPATATRELLGSVALKDVPPTPPTTKPPTPPTPTVFPDFAAKLKAWLEANDEHARLLVTLEGATNELTVGGTGQPRKALLALNIRPYPPAHLFTVPFKWKPNVYTKIVDGHLNYDGQRLRLWGVVGYPDAERLINMGFNAQRIWEPYGHVGDGKTYTEESGKKGEYAPYTKGDGSETDLADKHFADIKAHGMFVMLAALTQTAPYEPIYADDSFIAGGEDWAQWKEAMQVPKAGSPYHYIFVDERLQKLKLQGAKNLLTHVNLYTGKTYGEEENIAVYEVYNENGFVEKMLSGGLDLWPPYFKNKMQKKWNAWLVAKYKDDAGLTTAWGKLDDGENLSGGTVVPGPIFNNRLKYSEVRGGDFVDFIINLEDGFNQQFRSYCRTLAPAGVGVNVVPFSFDTMYKPNLPWAYTDCRGDVFSYGMYYWDLKSLLDKPPQSYLIDSFTVQKVPTVLYETNIGRPNSFRAEYPIKLAAFASNQDFDGIFWHYWSPLAGQEGNIAYLNGTLAPPLTTHYWTAVQHQVDPVMCTAMALGSRIFLNHYLPPAESPKIYKLGQKAIYSYDGFRGINVAPAAFSRGAALQFDAPDPAARDGLSPVVARLKNAVATGRNVVWDWPNGRLIIDAPDIKAYVGRTNGEFRFSDGITFGKVNAPWVSFVIESADGKPLVGPDATTKILMGAVADAKNTGFVFDYNAVGGPLEQAKAVRTLGHVPVLVDKIEYSVWFPNQINGTLKSYDFALRETQSTALSNNNLVVQQGPTPFLDSLDITSRGDKGDLPLAEATKIDTDNPTSDETVAGPSVEQGLKASDLVEPITGLDWTMDYVTAHKYIENSVLQFGNLDKLDMTANADKTMAIADLQLPSFWNNSADASVTFHQNHMTGLELTLKAPPPVEDLIKQFSTFIGEPADKKLDAQYGTTRIFWKGHDASPDITVTESQGIMKVLYAAHMVAAK